MQHLYPDLGIDLGERAYGADCRLYIEGHGVNWPVIRATLFDEFVVAHTLGWWAKVCPHSDLCSMWLVSVALITVTIVRVRSCHYAAGMVSPETQDVLCSVELSGAQWIFLTPRCTAGADHSGPCAAVGAVNWF